VDTDRLMEFLAKEGFRPTLAAPGDVRFKYDGGNYGVWFPPGDDQYVAITFPKFWQVGSPEEEVRALRAANEATVGTKVAQVTIMPDQWVWAEIQMYLTAPEQLEAVFLRCLDTLKYAVDRFVEAMRKSQPLPDKRIELKRQDVTRWMHKN
jgi:hypothetical protein